MRRAATKKLNQGISVTFLLLILISLGSYWSIRREIQTRKNVVNSQQIISAGNRLLIDLQDVKDAQKQFAANKDSSSLRMYEENLVELPYTLKELRSYLEPESSQMNRLDSIEHFIDIRIDILKDFMTLLKSDQIIPAEDIEYSNILMDSCRSTINRFIDFETNELKEESKALDSISLIISIVTIFAEIISLIVVFIFFLQIRRDIIRRDDLQKELKYKDEIITRRIQVTQVLAEKIANGNYSVRIEDDETDDLGSLSSTLNDMAASLESSFNKIRESEWRQSGIALLNETLNGNKSPQAISSLALNCLVNYCGCINGAFYTFNNEGFLTLESFFGFESHMKEKYAIGEGIIGQAYLDQQVRVLNNSNNIASCSNGLLINHVFVLPLIAEDRCLAVIELGSTEAFSDIKVVFLEHSSRIIALSLLAAMARMKALALLEETQAQSNILQVQHSELEKLNKMLASHAEQLQASENELKIQQQELLSANKELESRSNQLEEKNQIVASRNLEIQKKVEELATITRYKSEFLANMSHELRTPLNSILLLSRLMTENLDGNLNEDQIESARVIESSGTSLLNLIDEILDLSKIEAGKMDLDYQSISLKSVVSSLEGMFRPIVLNKGLGFTIEILNDTPEFIDVDKLRLEQILRNLLSNAIKFTSKGYVKLKIFLDSLNPNMLTFQVEDTGLGIESKNLQLIFEAFKQADGSTRRQFGGTGLGLSISRELAKLLKGDLRVESEFNKGSIFTLLIPILREHTIDN